VTSSVHVYLLKFCVDFLCLPVCLLGPKDLSSSLCVTCNILVSYGEGISHKKYNISIIYCIVLTA
jgi:hypothetical protein